MLQRITITRNTRLLPAVTSLIALAACTDGCRHASSDQSEDVRPHQLVAFEERPNVIFITIDTLRADHMDVHGYSRKTGPVMAEMAARGILFENALAQAPWTLPSVASMHTSLYPSQHGAVNHKSKLANKHVTLAEAMRKAGYHTVGVVANKFCGQKYGLAQGYNVFHKVQMNCENEVTSGAVVGLALDRTTDAQDKPLFLWTHFMDPHFNYIRHSAYDFASKYEKRLPRNLRTRHLKAKTLKNQVDKLESSRNFLSYLVAVYDEEIAYTDYWIGELLEGLERQGHLDRAVIIITADHGEYFMERGRLFHDGDVYPELVHVPLIIVGATKPRHSGLVIEQAVELRSIPLTVMELIGVDNEHFDGENLLSLLAGDREDRFLFTEGSWAWKTDDRNAAVVHDGWKLVRNLDDDSYELYHSEVDHWEKKNLWDKDRSDVVEIKELLKDRLDGFVARKGEKAPSVKLDKDDIKRLEALGYIHED